MSAFRILIALGIGLMVPLMSHAENIIEDGGIGISQAELEYIVSNWPENMQRAAASDEGDRLELLNMVMVVKKLAREADQMAPGTDTFFRYKQKIDSEKRKFILNDFSTSLEIPDMTELSKERYETQKDKYAVIPERRASAHILISCRTGSACSRPEAQAKAQEVLDQLHAGASFEDLVELHSGDPGSKARGGKLKRWIALGEPGVTPPYSKGLFEIQEVGQYSGIVNSQFGVHIIRLDGIQEKSYKPYEQVKTAILDDLESEYRKLAVKDYRAQFNLSDESYIDGDAMDEIFSKYRTAN